MKDKWFLNKAYTSLEIIKFKSISDSKVTKAVKIDNIIVIEELINKIKQISEGNKMISFSKQAELIDLVFNINDQTQTIQIINKRFKTPSTGFNSGKSSLEQNLYIEITDLLFSNFD